MTRGVVEGEHTGTEFPHLCLSPKNILGGKNRSSIRFLHLLKVACVGRSHPSKFSTTTLGMTNILEARINIGCAFPWEGDNI